VAVPRAVPEAIRQGASQTKKALGADVSTVVDVGGADGQFILELMAANPGLRGQVLDLTHAVEGARRGSRCVLNIIHAHVPSAWNILARNPGDALPAITRRLGPA
jgi:hypothetical protein